MCPFCRGLDSRGSDDGLSVLSVGGGDDGALMQGALSEVFSDSAETKDISLSDGGVVVFSEASSSRALL